MEIWVHSLIKNEARWLWYSVNSIIDHVDKLILWDTGSSDGSKKIEKEVIKKFPDKILFKAREQKTSEEFTKVRQEMLDETDSDWFIVLDGDEVWWKDSIKNLIKAIKNADSKTESIVVPTINLVGDIFHYQSENAGRYRFGDKVGHYNLRAIKRNIPGLHSQGIHGVWGWADKENKMIQERNTYKFIKAPYLHLTNLTRSSKDIEVIKRKKKMRHELGINFPKDFYYPEVFFKETPYFVESPWIAFGQRYYFRAFFETPLRRVKRKIWQGSPGY